MSAAIQRPSSESGLSLELRLPDPAPFNALVEQAAVRLGANPADAQRIRKEGVLIAEGLPVVLAKVPPLNGKAAGFMLYVDSGQPVGSETKDVAGTLQGAPGLLHTQGVALGATDGRTWALFRFLPLDGLSVEAFVAEIVALRRLVDVAFPTAKPDAAEAER